MAGQNLENTSVWGWGLDTTRVGSRKNERLMQSAVEISNLMALMLLLSGDFFECCSSTSPLQKHLQEPLRNSWREPMALEALPRLAMPMMKGMFMCLC